MKGRQITTKIKSSSLPNGKKHYYAIINGKEEGLSWYGQHLSPEGKPSSTKYIIAQELDKDYGNFLGWYIDRILD